MVRRPRFDDSYVQDTGDRRFSGFLAVEDDTPLGNALVRRHFDVSAELHLIAVAPEHRGRGIGRELVTAVAEDLAVDGCRLLSVHTVGPSHVDEFYEQTRRFYRALGFLPLEEHAGLDWPGPSVIFVLPLPGV